MYIDRRRFLNLAVAVAALDIAGTSELLSANPAAKIKAVAFDGFVIFDQRPISVLAEELFPSKGADFMTQWRTRQFEYTWLRTLTHSYVDFWQVTQEALEFAGKALKIEVSVTARQRLMESFLHLKAWPDAISALTALKAAGVRMAFLSNFSTSMLDENIKSAGLAGFFENHLSTDKVRAFKPDPASYQMAIDHFRLQRQEIAFAAFGGWDAVGAKRFGYHVFWCNRLRQPAEELGILPDVVRNDCADLPEFVGAGLAVS